MRLARLMAHSIHRCENEANNKSGANHSKAQPQTEKNCRAKRKKENAEAYAKIRIVH